MFTLCAQFGCHEKILSFNEQPEIIYVYVSYMEYGSTHKHSLRRARQTHEKVRINSALPAYSNKPHKRSSAGQVWLDQAVSCLKKGPSHMNEYSFKQMDPNETETAVGKNFNHNSPYAANSIYYVFGTRDTHHWMSSTQEDYCRHRCCSGSDRGSRSTE